MVLKLKTLLTFLTLAFALTTFLLPALSLGTASALSAADCASGKITTQTTKNSDGSTTKKTVCAELGNDCTGTNGSSCVQQTPLTKDLQNIVNALAAGVGVVVVGSIIVGGIQYIIAGDQPNGVQEAKKRITNALLALVAFFLTYAFLQWLIPGGIF